MNKKAMSGIYVYGASGHGKIVAETCLAAGFRLEAFVDDDPNKAGFFQGIPVLSVGEFPDCEYIIGIGDNRVRASISVKKKLAKPAIHPSVLLANEIQIGDGTLLAMGSAIQTGTRIGKSCIVNTMASVDHDCTIEDYVHIGPNATLCGGIVVGEGTLIGAGSTVIPGVKIGRWCTVGAGSVVIRDVEDNSTVAGNPAVLKRMSDA